MFELIRKNIIFIQNKLNLKSNEFAKQLGISKGAYSNYTKSPTKENPKEYKPKLNVLLKVSKLSNYSLNDLLETDLENEELKFIFNQQENNKL
jgi:Helix-turn-helix.